MRPQLSLTLWLLLHKTTRCLPSQNGNEADSKHQLSLRFSSNIGEEFVGTKKGPNPWSEMTIAAAAPASAKTPEGRAVDKALKFITSESEAESYLYPFSSYVLRKGDGGLRRDDDEEDGKMGASMILALANAVKKLGGLDIAKEVYLGILSRQHPFPFCAWQVNFDPQLFTPVLLDTNSIYWLQAFHFKTRNDVFRITGRFPLVRYFGFQSYDSAGKPLSSLPDFQIQPRPGDGPNPFAHCSSSSAAISTTSIFNSSSIENTGYFEIYVTADGRRGFPNELAALKDPSALISTTTILYRLYGAEPKLKESKQAGRERLEKGEESAARWRQRWRLWGFVEPPVVERRVMSTTLGKGEEEAQPMTAKQQTGPGTVYENAIATKSRTPLPKLSSPPISAPCPSPTCSSAYPPSKQPDPSSSSSLMRWETLPPCSQWDLLHIAQQFIAAEKKYLLPLPAQDDVCGLYTKASKNGKGIVPHMYPYGHLESQSVHDYVVYTNKDSNYLYWCDATHRLGNGGPENFVLVLQGKLPRTPVGLFDSPRISDFNAYDARYVSISTVENMAPSDTYMSVQDAELEHFFLNRSKVGANVTDVWDREYTIVAAGNESILHDCAEGTLPAPLRFPSDPTRSPNARNDSYTMAQLLQSKQIERPPTSSDAIPYYFLPFAREGLAPPRLPGLVYREILSRYRVTGEPDASAAYLQHVCGQDGSDKWGARPLDTKGKVKGVRDPVQKSCREADTLAEVSEKVMGEYYPRVQIYACVARESKDSNEEEAIVGKGGLLGETRRAQREWRRLN